MTGYRNLTSAETAALEKNGCSSTDWAEIRVAEPFSTENIARTHFSGPIVLEKNVVIRHVESLVSTGESTFGAGTKVAVLNEAGGREVPIYNELTAQIACLSAMYRHRGKAIQAIEKLIGKEIAENGPKCVVIGAGSYIAHCGALTDICTGENTVIQGVAELTNGTVNSSADAPTTVGRGVIARDFIVAEGAEVTDFAQIERCFVGQGCRVGKGFTAVDSLFFANCHCEQGEACAVFAGPYTVTHHKSTLLIGGQFSFCNAGSGTNMSNHMYRLGPVHQGVMERGCKTGSGSYILFPARVGAFSVVIGRHDGHVDTGHLPFSYLTEREGKTVVLPGQVLKSVGLARDARKWPARDRRKGFRRDSIVFEVLNPYTISQILNGLDSPDVGRGKEIYRTAVDAWLGEMVAKNAINKTLHSGGNKILIPREVNDLILHKNTRHETGWIDLAGLIAPTAEVEKILDMLPAMHSIQELALALRGLYEHYEEWAWAYARSLMGSSDFQEVVARGMDAAEKMLKWQLADAAKEFAPAMRVGYASDEAFAAIHGEVENHPFVRELIREFEQKQEKARELLKTDS